MSRYPGLFLVGLPVARFSWRHRSVAPRPVWPEEMDEQEYEEEMDEHQYEEEMEEHEYEEVMDEHQYEEMDEHQYEEEMDEHEYEEVMDEHQYEEVMDEHQYEEEMDEHEYEEMEEYGYEEVMDEYQYEEEMDEHEYEEMEEYEYEEVIDEHEYEEVMDEHQYEEMDKHEYEEMEEYEYEEVMDKHEYEEMEEYEYEDVMDEYQYEEEMDEHEYEEMEEYEYEEVMDEHEYEEMEEMLEMDKYEYEEEMLWMMMMCGGVTTCSLDLHVSCNLETILQDESSRPHNIPLQDLKAITDNFSDNRILGQGGFSAVYKGVLPNGDTIAVKRIVSSLMPGLQKQFESEVYHLMMLKHPNIVRFVGYCYETKNECLPYHGKYVFAEMAEKLLCFEYLPKGSLDKYLSDESSGLDWSTRYKIIEGICYGLYYLHQQIDKPIIHLDLKPANILLDDSLITDFGLSRLLGQQQTICTSSCIGTFGYMAPEFLHRGIITPKSDIFSLGVIILEVVTGHRDYPDVTRAPSDDFIEFALEKWRNVLQGSPRYGSLETNCEQIKRCLQVGLICVNPDRTKRPPIVQIINILQGLESINCSISNEAA